MAWLLEEAPTQCPYLLGQGHAGLILLCFTTRLDRPARGYQRFFEGLPDLVWPKNRNVLNHRTLRASHRLACGLSSALPSPILDAGLRWKTRRGKSYGLEDPACLYHGFYRRRHPPA